MQQAPVRPAAAVILLALAVLLPAGLAAQSLDGTGTVATGLLLRQMDGEKRVLMIGAHPDDEDTSLLTTLARGRGAQTAYLSLTRGEGGQNLIGPELWDGLGIIRTGELESARRLDGGSQFFTRAFDFGFSKQAEEALTIWPRDELLGDVVWIIRKFRPQVVVTVFTGTPDDGHGHHQAAGILAREAFDAAGDPARFPAQLSQGVEAWAPAKLYQLTRGRVADATTAFETGAFDPLLGRSYHQLSAESRSQHRSQDQGTPETLGPRTTGVRLVKARDAGATDEGLFAGIDTTLVGASASLPEPAGARTRAYLEAYRIALSEARLASDASTSSAAESLRRGLSQLYLARDASGASAGTELSNVIERRIDLARRAVLSTAGVVLDVRAADDAVIPGQAVAVTAQAWNGGPESVRDLVADLDLPSGWTASLTGTAGLAPDGSLGPGALASWTFDLRVPVGAEPSRLYYLRGPRDGAWYRWPEEPDVRGLPRDPPPVRATFGLSMGSEGREVGVERSVPWSYVGVNPARGEFRRPVLIVPKASASVTPTLSVWPQARSEPRAISVVVRSEAPEGIRGDVSLVAPEGWSVLPDRRPVELAGAASERSYTFEVRPMGAPAAGSHAFQAVVSVDDGRRYEEGFEVIDYEHIERAALFAPAEARVAVVPVTIAEGLRVGYIMGPGDEGPEAIEQLGSEVALLGEDEVRAGAFAAYDVVVVGVRAYETRPELRSANGQLLDFARAGGTVIVQYQQWRSSTEDTRPIPLLRTGRPTGLPMRPRR